jgi:hypothetical protein
MKRVKRPRDGSYGRRDLLCQGAQGAHHLLSCIRLSFTPVPPSRRYLEIYEYLLSQGADPALLTKEYDPYLDPGRKTPADVAVPDPAVRASLAALEARYAHMPKAPVPHPDIGCWWTLYDYGLDVVKGWAPDYVHPYPGELFPFSFR